MVSERARRLGTGLVGLRGGIVMTFLGKNNRAWRRGTESLPSRVIGVGRELFGGLIYSTSDSMLHFGQALKLKM